MIITADIGGSNTRIAVINERGKIKTVHRYKTKEVKDILKPIQILLTKDTKEIILGAAGPGGRSLTNADLKINPLRIQRKTGIKVRLMNDVEMFSYSVLREKGRRKLILCIGTGLGKAAGYDNYVISSEGGHCDMPSYNPTLEAFIRGYKKLNRLTWEDVLSARGIESIYFYISKDRARDDILRSKERAEIIGELAKKDKCCACVFKIFNEYLSNAVKNFSLDMNADSVYLGGGIITHNKKFISVKRKWHIVMDNDAALMGGYVVWKKNVRKDNGSVKS